MSYIILNESLEILKSKKILNMLLESFFIELKEHK